MIGGTDIVVTVPGGVDPEWERSMLLGVFALWPESVLEDTETDGAVPLHQIVPGELPSEFFIYKSPQWLASWDADGATEENANTMIHFLLNGESVTWVIAESPDDEVRMISEHVRLGLLSRGGH